MNEGLRDWVANVHDTFYIIGTAAGPHPLSRTGARFPERDRQAKRGAQMLERTGRLPDLLAGSHRRRVKRASACSILFSTIADVQDAWRRGGGLTASTDRRSRRQPARAAAPGILHGNKTYLLQDEDGQITEAHSISAGLDYPGSARSIRGCTKSGRVKYVPITDDEALEAFQLCCKLEGIIPALESAHALAALPKLAKAMDKDRIILVNVSGRGDKDIFTVADALGVEL